MGRGSYTSPSGATLSAMPRASPALAGSRSNHGGSPLGQVSAIPQLGDGQVDRAGRGVPRPAPVAASAVRPLLRAFGLGGAADRVGLLGHHSLDDLRHQIGVGLLDLLANARTPSIWSTTVLLLSEFRQLSLRMTRWSSRSTTFRASFVHQVRGPLPVRTMLRADRQAVRVQQERSRSAHAAARERGAPGRCVSPGFVNELTSQRTKGLTPMRTIGPRLPSPTHGRRPSAESAAIRNAAATNARLCFGMTTFLLNRWIFAVPASLSSALLT